MKYAQLDTRAQERARDAWREAGNGDDWWDAVYEDAVTVGKLLGIEISENVTRTVGGQPVKQYDINFSGFHHQGSYCAFAGYIDVARLNGCVARVKEHVSNLSDEGGDEDLFTICTRAQAAFDGISAHWVANRLSDTPSDEWEAPECTPTMTVLIDNRNERCKVSDDDVSSSAEDDLNTLVWAFADWIYSHLEAEDEHLNSDAHVIESIEANEPDFDEDGNFE